LKSLVRTRSARSLLLMHRTQLKIRVNTHRQLHRSAPVKHASVGRIGRDHLLECGQRSSRR
jgi:hypothetical protein